MPQTVPSSPFESKTTPTKIIPFKPTRPAFFRPQPSILHFTFADSKRPPFTIQPGATIHLNVLDHSSQPSTIEVELDWKDLYPASCVLQGYTIYNDARHRVSIFMNASSSEADYIVLAPHL